MRDFLGYCLSWACCPLVNAVCCDDHQHCCPHNLPVCDVTAGRCLAGVGQGFEDSVPWTTKQPLMKVCPAALRPQLLPEVAAISACSAGTASLRSMGSSWPVCTIHSAGAAFCMSSVG